MPEPKAQATTAIDQARRAALPGCLLWGLAGIATAQTTPTTATPEAARAEAVVRRFWDAFNRAAWAEFDDLVTPGYAHHPPGKSLSLAQFKAGGARVHRAFSSYQLVIDALVAGEPLVAARWTARGNHVGSFFGEAPSGRELAVQGMHFHRLADGRIAEDWEVIDFDGLKAGLARVAKSPT